MSKDRVAWTMGRGGVLYREECLRTGLSGLVEVAG